MDKTSMTHVATIGELAVIYPGYSPKPVERKKNGKYLLISGRNIKDGRLIVTEKDAYINDTPKDSFRRAVAQSGDIIVSTLFDQRKLYIYRDGDPQGVVNSSCAIIRAPEKNDYIVSYLRTIRGQEQFLHDANEATSGNIIPRLTVAALAGIQVPLLPLSELQRLGDDHIESSPTDNLIALRSELQSKDVQINELREQMNALRGENEEVEKLRMQIAYYEDRLLKIESQIYTNDLKDKIAHGETSRLEFKSSLRWNLKASREDPTMELMVLKTIAAFCNTEGGELLIGVADDHTILGIEHDHFPNDDKFLLHLRNLIVDRLIPNVVQYVDYEIMNLDNNKICRVICKQSVEDIWVKTGKNTPEAFYVRTGPSSTELLPRDASRYIRTHF